MSSFLARYQASHAAVGMGATAPAPDARVAAVAAVAAVAPRTPFGAQTRGPSSLAAPLDQCGLSRAQLEPLLKAHTVHPFLTPATSFGAWLQTLQPVYALPAPCALLVPLFTALQDGVHTPPVPGARPPAPGHRTLEVELQLLYPTTHTRRCQALRDAMLDAGVSAAGDLYRERQDYETRRVWDQPRRPLPACHRSRQGWRYPLNQDRVVWRQHLHKTVLRRDTADLPGTGQGRLQVADEQTVPREAAVFHRGQNEGHSSRWAVSTPLPWLGVSLHVHLTQTQRNRRQPVRWSVEVEVELEAASAPAHCPNDADCWQVAVVVWQTAMVLHQFLTQSHP